MLFQTCMTCVEKSNILMIVEVQTTLNPIDFNFMGKKISSFDGSEYLSINCIATPRQQRRTLLHVFVSFALEMHKNQAQRLKMLCSKVFS